jgi:WG containing repeat
MRQFVTSRKNIKHRRPLSAMLAVTALLLAGCGLIDTSQVVHYGYIDKTGNFVITPRFEIVREFSCERAVIGELADTKNYFYRWGFIDRSGNVVVKPQFKAVNSFSEGLAAVVLKDGKLGYIDKSGNFQIPAKFDSLPYETREAYETAPDSQPCLF